MASARAAARREAQASCVSGVAIWSFRISIITAGMPRPPACLSRGVIDTVRWRVGLVLAHDQRSVRPERGEQGIGEAAVFGHHQPDMPGPGPAPVDGGEAVHGDEGRRRWCPCLDHRLDGGVVGVVDVPDPAGAEFLRQVPVAGNGRVLAEHRHRIRRRRRPVAVDEETGGIGIDERRRKLPCKAAGHRQCPRIPGDMPLHVGRGNPGIAEAGRHPVRGMIAEDHESARCLGVLDADQARRTVIRRCRNSHSRSSLFPAPGRAGFIFLNFSFNSEG